MKSAVVAIAYLAAACGPAAPGADDSGMADRVVPTSDAAPPVCGNGIVERSVLVTETCDEGANNGSATSLCTLECIDARFDLEVAWTVIADVAVRDMLWVQDVGPVATGLDVLWAASGTDPGIHVLHDAQFGPTPPSTDVLAIRSPTTGLAVVGRMIDEFHRPVWIEEPDPGEATPHLYLAEIDISGTTVLELAYPITPSAGGRAFGVPTSWDQNAALAVVDTQSAAPARLVGAWTDFSDTTWDVFDLGDAPDGREVGARELIRADKRWIARHFNDPPWLVVHEVSLDGLMTTRFSGPAPSNVVSSFAADPHNSDASRNDQLIVLEPDGTVAVWEITTDNDLTRAEFGRVDPDSRDLTIIQANDAPEACGPFECWDVAVIEPDGELAVLVNNGLNQSVAVQRVDLGEPCQSCAFAGAHPLTAITFAVLATEQTIRMLLFSARPQNP